MERVKNTVFDAANVAAMTSGIDLQDQLSEPLAKVEPSTVFRTPEFLDFTRKLFRVMTDSDVRVAASVEVKGAPTEGVQGDWFAWWSKDAIPRLVISPSFYSTIRTTRKNKVIVYDKTLNPKTGGINGYAPKIRAVWYEFDPINEKAVVKYAHDLSGTDAAEFQRGTLLLRGKL